MADLETEKELVLINSLLRSREFSIEMAAALNAAYGEDEQELTIADEADAVTPKTVSSQKVATSLAGFYALECGVGLLCQQKGGSPAEWIKNIVSRTAEPDAVSLLNRFANATWKAGQPFRGLERINRYNFTVAALLSAEEIEKDLRQIHAAASFVLPFMSAVADAPLKAQMEQLRSLMQDTTFAVQVAEFIHAAHYSDKHRSAQVLLSDDYNTVIQKSVLEEKVAMNLAGFYALECGVNYLVSQNGVLPSAILKAVGNDTISAGDKTLLLCFANATWKAGQPFRGLDRIKRENFSPVYFLTSEEIDKDMVQIKVAAEKLLAGLQRL